MDETTPTDIARRHHLVRRMGHWFSMFFFGIPSNIGKPGETYRERGCWQPSLEKRKLPPPHQHRPWESHKLIPVKCSSGQTGTITSCFICTKWSACSGCNETMNGQLPLLLSGQPDKRTRSEFNLSWVSVFFTSWTHDGCKMDPQLLFAPVCFQPA